MEKFTTSIVKMVIDKAKRNKFIQNVFESPFNFENFESMGSFTDTKGNKHLLFDGLRSKIKPGWENISKVPIHAQSISAARLSKYQSEGRILANKILPLLNTMGKKMEDATILEFGCNSGAASLAMADLGAKKVVASDFSGYKVKAVNKEKGVDDVQLNKVNGYLQGLRDNLQLLFENRDKVEFKDDDICNTQLTPNSFDLICSWEVLEHIHDPAKAFKGIANLLKDDGITIHYYNPFFCINGGHGMCTLDFLWGHVRLNEQDFSNYMEEFRPDDKVKAMSFFRDGVNRMTHADLMNHMEDAGLDVVDVIPYSKEQHLRMINHDMLQQCQANYPNLKIIDLVTPEFVIIARKKLPS